MTAQHCSLEWCYFAMQGCQHERTEFLYRRDGIDYIRCVECGQVFESEDLDSVPVYEEEEEEKPRKRR